MTASTLKAGNVMNPRPTKSTKAKTKSTKTKSTAAKLKQAAASTTATLKQAAASTTATLKQTTKSTINACHSFIDHPLTRDCAANFSVGASLGSGMVLGILAIDSIIEKMSGGA